MINLLTIALVGVILPPIETTYAEKTYHSEQHESVFCSCVDYVRQFRKELPSMSAEDFTVSTSTPTKGSVAKMRYASGAWHLAYVADVKDGNVLLYHANVIPCKESQEWMDARNWRILGFF